ncbi:MAG: hypothetical protein F4Z97_02365 [Gammaproteobacteria bacterium]|nr:hypothetical protein [Gammaproteobacteria bacterium]
MSLILKDIIELYGTIQAPVQALAKSASVGVDIQKTAACNPNMGRIGTLSGGCFITRLCCHLYYLTYLTVQPPQRISR